MPLADISMHKLLVICGPTATGKTGLALQLGKKFEASGPEGYGPVGEIISADSRQVYKYMNIGTGKDLPHNSKFIIHNSKLGGYYKVGGVKIWGYDVVEPTDEFSVARYIKIAGKIIKDIWERDKLPILAGGTGLYIKGVVDGIPTAVVPKNIALRESLGKRGVKELFEILAEIDAVKAASLNISDKKNPRRLVRAIEIAGSKLKVHNSKFRADVLFVGLTAPKEVLYRNIEKRVEERLRKGIEEEIIKLLTAGVTWESQAMDSLGYRQWTPYSSYLLPRSTSSRRRSESTGQDVREKVIEEWKRAERQYAKRQITWFKKDKRINWFDIGAFNWQKSVEKLVRKWYKT